MGKRITVSIIVPVYNVEDYLRECINSILSQSYNLFELILVDDGSLDSCGLICDEFALLDERIIVIHKSNGGLSDARNAGIEIAKGEYITFIDGDDFIHKDYLKILVDNAVLQGADIVQGAYTRDVSALGNHENDHATFSMNGKEAFVQCATWKKVKVYAWCKLYRQSLFDNLRFPIGRLNEDSCIFYKLFCKASCFTIVPVYVYYYRDTPNSIMNSPVTFKRYKVMEVPDEMRAYFGRNSEYTDVIDYYEIRLGINLYNECFANKNEESDIVQGKLFALLKKADVFNKYLSVKYKILLFILRTAPRLYQALLLKFRK